MDSYKENILRFNTQLTYEGLTPLRLEKLRRVSPDGIVIAGMGGSGLAGEVIAALQKELRLRVPLIIWKDYGLPTHHFKKPLFIFVSFSGNTEETLSGLKHLPKKANAATVGTGGMLMKMANQRRLPLVSFDSGTLTPRQSTGRMLYSLIEILHAARVIAKIPAYSRLDFSSLEPRGKLLAERLANQLIIIYTTTHNKHIGYIWKITLNESAKVPAFANVIPEVDHNEIVGFDRPSQKNKNVTILFIEDPTDHPRNKKRFTLTQKLLARRGGRSIVIPMTGKTQFEKTWRTVVLAAWTSYYLAKRNHINPAATAIIDTLKRELT